MYAENPLTSQFILRKVPFLQVPLTQYYPEYTGGADSNKAAKFILWRFMQFGRLRLNIYPQ